jgi:hypothetical protein
VQDPSDRLQKVKHGVRGCRAMSSQSRVRRQFSAPPSTLHVSLAVDRTCQSSSVRDGVIGLAVPTDADELHRQIPGNSKSCNSTLFLRYACGRRMQRCAGPPAQPLSAIDEGIVNGRQTAGSTMYLSRRRLKWQFHHIITMSGIAASCACAYEATAPAPRIRVAACPSRQRGCWSSQYPWPVRELVLPTTELCCIGPCVNGQTPVSLVSQVSRFALFALRSNILAPRQDARAS